MLTYIIEEYKMNSNTDNIDINIEIITSSSVDPWFNLSLEEHLFNTISDNTVFLYLWQNKNTVVIGKSQNAWKECRISTLEADGGKLARRPSGGGAVFHDLGNLCYTFICSSNLYNLERQLSVILNAVKEHNIDAKFTGRNDIVTNDGRKFSGNAFRFSGDKGLMHGTLLLDTDSNKMAQYLQVSPAKMKAKGVNSVRSRVVNLIEINKAITVDGLNESLKRAFIKEYSTSVYTQPGNEIPIRAFSEINAPHEVLSLYQKYSSWSWRMGETPQFNASYETRFSWGCFEASFTASKGIIENIEIYTDAMDAELSEQLKTSLTGCKLSINEICENIKNAIILLNIKNKMIVSPEIIISDLSSWFREVL